MSEANGLKINQAAADYMNSDHSFESALDATNNLSRLEQVLFGFTVIKSAHTVEASQDEKNQGLDNAYAQSRVAGNAETIGSAAAHELHKMAYKDELSGLHNRRGIERMRVAAEESTPQQTAYFLIDFDDFKVFNKYCGHDVGDIVIKELSTIVRNSISGEIIRIGGDEIFAGVYDLDPELAEAQALEIGKRLNQKVRDYTLQKVRKDIMGNDLYDRATKLEKLEQLRLATDAITVSIGIVMGKYTEGPDQAFQFTSSALDEAKEQGKDTVAMYRPS